MLRKTSMSNYLNKPALDLRTTPHVRRNSWGPRIAIVVVAVVAVLAWNFWPYANSPSRKSGGFTSSGGAQSPTTQPPATQPAAAPAQQ